MLLLLRIILLIPLIKMVDITEKPFLCAGIYASVFFVLSLFSTSPFLPVLVVYAIRFGLASLYFWLLTKARDSIMLWWLILFCGICIGLV